MKAALLLIFIFLIPSSAPAHPGKTDHRGGHRCWKDCNEWGLGRGEYHLHDEDWDPVHVDRKGTVMEEEQVRGVPTPEKRFLMDSTVPGSVTEVRENKESNMPEQRSVATNNQSPVVYEENFLPFSSILLLLLVLLMLLVLIYVRKRQGKE